MPIEHIPLLKIERDLHDIPRGMERFQAYLKTIMNEDGDDEELDYSRYGIICRSNLALNAAKICSTTSLKGGVNATR